MRLRIISGELGGRFIDTPPGRATRPTREAVREAWFNALGDAAEGARVLDLFAGSGALGIEALSRGAREAHFVESDRRAATTLRDNLRVLGLSERATVTTDDVFRFLARDSNRKRRYNVALADPPYGIAAAERLLEVFEADPFAELLCMEHRRGALDGSRSMVWQRRYGDTELTFLTPA